jgi:hypothetical protein
MGRHPELEGLQVRLVRGRILSDRREGVEVVAIAMQPLPPVMSSRPRKMRSKLLENSSRPGSGCV